MKISRINSDYTNTQSYKKKVAFYANDNQNKKKDSPRDIAINAILAGFILSHHDITDYMAEGKSTLNVITRSLVVFGVAWLFFEKVKEWAVEIKKNGIFAQLK